MYERAKRMEDVKRLLYVAIHCHQKRCSDWVAENTIALQQHCNQTIIPTNGKIESNRIEYEICQIWNCSLTCCAARDRFSMCGSVACATVHAIQNNKLSVQHFIRRFFFFSSVHSGGCLFICLTACLLFTILHLILCGTAHVWLNRGMWVKHRANIG